MVVDLPEDQGGMTIVISHAGQAVNRDLKFLREQFGLDTERGFRLDMIIPLSQSRQRPLSASEKAAERASEPESVAPMPKTAREANLEADGADKDRLIESLMAQIEKGSKAPQGK